MRQQIVKYILSLVALLPACGRSENVNIVTIADRILLDVPTSVKLVQQSPVEDFILAQFTTEEALIVSAYIGNAPSFPGPDCSGPTKNTMVNRLHAQEVSGRSDSSCLKEILVDLGTKGSWPRYVHFRIQRSSENHVRLAAAIVNSVRLTARSVNPQK
jgi:hypothetical protein